MTETAISPIPLEEPSSTPKYVLVRTAGDLLFVSGQLPLQDGDLAFTGQVGRDVTAIEARAAAGIAAQRCLDAIAASLGSLDRIAEIVKVNGYVAAGPDFEDVAGVIDGASERFLSVLGERGKHARLAIGVSTLPRRACVEVEVIARTR